MSSFEIGFVFCCFCLSTFLFSKAAGTLKPNRLNVISYVYYIFMLQSFLGTSLILLGFDKHYTLNYLTNRLESLQITTLVVMTISIMLPLCIILVQKIFRLNIKEKFSDFIATKIEYQNEEKAFKILIVLSCISLFILCGLLLKIGYIPLVKLIHSPIDFNFSLERGRISNIYFISPYISNLFVLSGIPLLSYIVFSYALVVRKKCWTFLAMLMFVASIIVKTYKFEKSPVVFHIFVFFLIVLYYNARKIKLTHLILFGVISSLGIIIMYKLTGFKGEFLDIYNGPLGRTLFTEVGTLSYNFDMFPNLFPFLKGRSLSPTILMLLGIDKSMHLRSAKLLMAYYGSEKVYDGGAGVMNSLFAGEAYANFGFLGLFFSVIWVAVYVTLIMWIVLKLRKTPESVVYLAVMTVRVGSMLEGGFVDFIYNFDIIFITTIILGLYCILEKTGKKRKRVLLYAKSIKK